MGDPERCQELDPKRDSRSCYPNDISGSTANLYIGPAIAFVVRSGILRRTLPITIVEGSFTANQDMKILHNISEDFDVRFIHHLVRSKEAGIRSSCAKSGTTVESIDFQKLLEFELRLPLIFEQKEIVRLVDSKLESQIPLFKALLGKTFPQRHFLMYDHGS
ncbi:hypothetical protein FRC0522_02093 [Corynebacterium diphtheriae]|nr:hypothetical protein FRC0522_02093 [Corynebacterium diphtheriae]